MPRVTYFNGEYNENLDYCKTHMPTQEQADEKVAEKAEDGEVTIDSEHPSYEGEGYTCETCHRTLTNLDD